MFLQCRKEMKDSLIRAGMKAGQIYTSKKKLSLCRESRVGAVLFEEDALARNKEKRIYMSEGLKHKRRKKYNRDVSFSVVIGEYDMEALEALYNLFLSALPDGIWVDGNWVDIEPTEADWMEDEDTILKSKCAVQIKIICRGGIYTDTDFAPAGDVDIMVKKEKDDGK